MDLYLVLLLGFLSAVKLSQAQPPVEEEPVVARNVEPLGGWIEAQPERSDVQEAARKGVEKFNMKSKAKKYFKLLDITSAKIQVTNMINFKIEATVAKTKCLKTKPADLETCALGRKRLTCNFVVEYNPRNDQHVVKMLSCKK
ncbi:cystatin [Colossoma macropomum]|uniref:cystatin n=1 Tax=Colossoma macropomum TaxID=42526 RepID=UPI001863AF84|nr:cystatin [Colossoma macropomum]